MLDLLLSVQRVGRGWRRNVRRGSGGERRRRIVDAWAGALGAGSGQPLPASSADLLLQHGVGCRLCRGLDGGSSLLLRGAAQGGRRVVDGGGGPGLLLLLL